MKAGDIVRVRAAGSNAEWCPGTLLLVSPNGRSVAVRLDGCVGAKGGGLVCGVLPLLIDDQRGTAEGLDGQEYEVEVGR